MKQRNYLAMAMGLALLAPAMAFAQDAAPAAEEASEGAWSVAGSIDFVSDYVFRGISQTNEEPAIQIGASLSHESGFYGGAWASTVNFDTPGDGISTEFDYYLGWNHDLTDSLNLDLLANRYTYPHSNAGYDYDYNEYFGKLTIAENYFVLLAYADDYAGSGEGALYYQAGASMPVGESDWTVSASLGHYDLDDVYGDSYQDYSVGVSTSLGPVGLTLSYVGTSNAENIAPSEWTDDRLVAKVSIPFEF
jgi:uncharacterized protein (TIGR02001 family)